MVYVAKPARDTCLFNCRKTKVPHPFASCSYVSLIPRAHAQDDHFLAYLVNTVIMHWHPQHICWSVSFDSFDYSLPLVLLAYSLRIAQLAFSKPNLLSAEDNEGFLQFRNLSVIIHRRRELK